MELFTIKCPNCGASLDIENDIDTFYCKYCGSKLVLDGLSLDAIHARVRLAEMRHEEEMKGVRIAEMRHEREMAKESVKARKAEGRAAILKNLSESEKIAGSIGLLASFLLFFLMIGAFAGIPYAKHYLAERELIAIESSLQEHVREGDFVSARMEANQLRLESGWSSDAVKDWDEKREYYLRLISEEERKAVTNAEDVLFAPISSKQVKGKSLDDVKTTFESAGFTNINTIKLEGSPGWFKPAQMVDHVLFGGKTTFTTEDYCAKDARIVIYYQSK